MRPETSAATPKPVAPAETNTTRDRLHRLMLDLNLLTNGPCPPQDCTNRARMILARATEVKQVIAESPDRERLRPAVDIVGELAGVTDDSAADPAVQRQIVETGVELTRWLTEHW
ncbi:hypothetical protein AOZ06_46900 [Kibdelosporangium phytohabitans]|uniref:Uncharacterized protein n=2 Tax=Kibdelosporangium phytohabitans TaxID=860235 RepID=A0A0N9IE40_9PSEU|nr:hypothetical protein AOZ06_46900 [Kibdelosporangium phytohabitans]